MTVKQPTPAQLAAIKARQEAASVSPAVAENLGAPLGNTFDFAPDDLPSPGSTPGGAAQGGVKPESFGDGSRIGPPQGLVDDRDALVNQGAMPAAPPPEPPRGPTKPLGQQGRAEHPLLQKLREDLGIAETKVYDVKIGNHTWTIRAVTAGDLPYVWRLTDQNAETFGEQKLIYESLVAAHSVVAIDHVPTYVVFGVWTEGVEVTDPYNPPRRIHQKAALRLYEFLCDQRMQTLQRLVEAYVDKCDSDGAVESYLDDPAHKRIKFRCGKCDDVILLVPRRKPGSDEVIAPLCHWDATPMTMEVSDPLA